MSSRRAFIALLGGASAASAIMNASIASPWHRARSPVGNGRNRCNVCQRYLGMHQRAWTAAACSADNEVF